MKNPTSFLTFSSISLTVCLLSQYLTSPGVQELFSKTFSGHGSAACAAFFGVSRIAQLLFGIYTAKVCEKNRFVNHYFFGFSQVVYILVHVFLFENRATFAAALFLLILLLMTAALTKASECERKWLLLILPQAAICFFMLFLCF